MDTPQRLLLLHRTPTLLVLTLSASTVAEDAAVAAVVGTLVGQRAGSTVSISAQSNSGWFSLDTSTFPATVKVAGTLDFETNPSPTITVLQTYPGVADKSTVLTITVTDVVEGYANQALSPDDITTGDWTIIALATGTHDFSGALDRFQGQAFYGTNSAGLQQSTPITGGTSGKTIRVRVSMQSNTGVSQTVRLKNTHGGVADNYSANLTVTTTLQEFIFPVTNAASAGTGLQVCGIANSDSGVNQDILIDTFYVEVTS